MKHFGKFGFLLFGVVASLMEGAAAQNQFSQPTPYSLQDGLSVRELLNQSIGYALQNPPTEFKSIPQEVNDADLMQHFANSVQSRWALEWSKDDWDLYGDSLNQIDFKPPSGIDQQPIDPEAATGKYAHTSPEGSTWNIRVTNWQNAQRSASMLTCKEAIAALYVRACDNPENCDVESEYEQNCAIQHSHQSDAEACIAVVSDYGNSCYLGPGLEGFEFDTLSGGGTSERPLCNVTSFSHGNQIAFATAGHCANDGAFMSEFHRSYDLEENFFKEYDGPFGTFGDFSFLQSDEALQILTAGLIPLKSGKPRKFAPTIFAGNNSLAFMANETAKLNGISERSGLYWFDKSPLCTIVQYDERSGEILHTCQTTNGGSGGTLVQKHGETYVVVGVHTGPSEKDHNTTNIAQFASASAFRD